jgi:hypothetical protein
MPRRLLLGFALLAACGPIRYIDQVTRRASTEVEAARAAQADRYAPYWYTLAVEYLDKAREEGSRADFQAAHRFGKRAEDAARKATTEALAAARGGAAGTAAGGVE